MPPSSANSAKVVGGSPRYGFPQFSRKRPMMRTASCKVLVPLAGKRLRLAFSSYRRFALGFRKKLLQRPGVAVGK